MRTKNTARFLGLSLCLLFSGVAWGQTTYSVVKASASMSGYLFTTKTIDGAPYNYLFPGRLSTSGILNLARGRAYNAKVPKNEMLGVAANYSNTFGSGNGPGRLVVVDTTNAPNLTVLATIITGSAPTDVIFNEEWSPKSFKRVGVASLVLQSCGNGTNGFSTTGSRLYGAGILTRTPSPTGPIPKVQMTFNGTGFVNMAGYKKQNFSNTRFYINSGKFSGSGKIIGTFTQ